MYKKCNEVERLFRRLKGFRHIFSRFEKLDIVYRFFINFALILDKLVSVKGSPADETTPSVSCTGFTTILTARLVTVQIPFDRHYRMYSYVQQELPALVGAEFNVDLQRQGISGHSMGGHGALTLALNHPEQYRSVSAFSPICAPSQCPWGEKALTGYLGVDRQKWRAHDAVALLQDRGYDRPILIEQGLADKFLHTQLKPELLLEACANAGVDMTLNYRSGYDHSYYFIASFIEDHLRFHYDRLA